MNTAQITKLAVAALEDVKGTDIQIIDVSSFTPMTDHMVICTGTSSRHVRALAAGVMDKAYEAGIRPLSGQGLEQGDWALVDLNGVIVHVMQATARASYQLEKLWDMGQAPPRLDEPKAAKPKAPASAKAKPAATTRTKEAAVAKTRKVGKAAAAAVVKAVAKPSAKPAAPLKARPAAKASTKAAAKPVAKPKPGSKPATAARTKAASNSAKAARPAKPPLASKAAVPKKAALKAAAPAKLKTAAARPKAQKKLTAEVVKPATAAKPAGKGLWARASAKLVQGVRVLKAVEAKASTAPASAARKTVKKAK